MRILGIDPGSRATGYGVVDIDGAALRRVMGGVIRCAEGTVGERLADLDLRLSVIISEACPDVSAIESIFTSRNPRSALLLGQARGVAIAACARAGLATAEYAPTQIKAAAVGTGRADKGQVQSMVQRLLALKKRPPSDEADALAVAICHAHSRPWPDLRPGVRP